MKKKQICIDIDSIVPLYARGCLSGVGRTTLELVQALDKLSATLPFKITLYSQNMKGIGGRNLGLSFPNKHLYWPHRERYDKILSEIPVKEWLTGYDVMHIPHNFEYIYRPSRAIVTLHDALFMKMQENAFSHHQLRKLVPPLMHQCKAVITCSEYSKQDIVTTMGVDPEKISVIPWGIRHDLFFPEKDKSSVTTYLQERFGLRRNYFLSVSCSMERKNTSMLVDAYIKLASQGLQHDLCLVWNAPQVIREKIIQAKLSDRVHLVNDVKDEELRLLYAGATATVFPSLYEGFGLPVLESMACGTPVVASRVTSLPEVGGDVPIYIDPLDIHTIEKALAGLEENRYNTQEMSEKGIRRALLFTWEKCAEKTAEVYHKSLL